MAGSENQGTEDPTQRRRDEAREEGQVVFSPDLNAAVAVFLGALILMWTGSQIGDRLLRAVRMWIRPVPSTDWTDFHTVSGAWWFTSELAGSTALLVILVAASGLLVAFFQVGFVISTKPLEVNFEKLSPVRGWNQVFSLHGGVRGLLGLARVTMLMAVAVGVLWLRRDAIQWSGFGSVGELVSSAWQLGMTICISLAGVMLALALVDYLTRWYQQEQKLKMTREEIKDEQKDDNGDPQIRAMRRAMRREAMRRNSTANVPKADFVIKNPTHLAIAVQYDQSTMAAPIVVAKGADAMAQVILRIAKQHRIPVLERKPLARALFPLVEVGDAIPSDFYRAIAEILLQIMKWKRPAGAA